MIEIASLVLQAENEFGSAWTEGPIAVVIEGTLPTKEEGEAPDFIEVYISKLRNSSNLARSSRYC